MAGLGGGIEEDASVSGMAPGAGRGIGLGLGGIDRRRVSTSMRMLGGRVRGMGVKAVTLAKNASQASPTAHLRLGAASVHQKMLRQVRVYVCVIARNRVIRPGHPSHSIMLALLLPSKNQ